MIRENVRQLAAKHLAQIQAKPPGIGLVGIPAARLRVKKRDHDGGVLGDETELLMRLAQFGRGDRDIVQQIGRDGVSHVSLELPLRAPPQHAGDDGNRRCCQCPAQYQAQFVTGVAKWIAGNGKIVAEIQAGNQRAGQSGRQSAVIGREYNRDGQDRRRVGNSDVL